MNARGFALVLYSKTKKKFENFYYPYCKHVLFFVNVCSLKKRSPFCSISVAIPLIENDAYDRPSGNAPKKKDLLHEIDLSKILNEPTLKFTAEKSINPKLVERLQEIGRGHFGTVFKGENII